ncbi:MAG: hypothetical protein COZ06_35295 [Armatimonadetes bacterium CG_4_10_14_3_um_filter_66_18]|nr:MAG: hypothetical protein AUJ96_32725 [Armatimonadetes bacterium CG2_30_66_41]PIU87926.1 MAG: hypothetical protein COS65_32120 [Armatimonadetes bacterium CG06_land_8_20_14_3_00_66_21]PIY36668.1 MAG: hypothetical protein COZ06_35295 [Armatimonadetes bacterium CG_4_10_14_3_um_filter_66_18]
MHAEVDSTKQTGTIRLLAVHPEPQAYAEFDGLALPGGSVTALVERAASELSALRAAAEVQPDVVLVEVDQSAFDPFALGQALSGECPDACLVFVGDTADSHNLRRALTCGAHEYLIRPLDLRAVAEALADVISRQRQRLESLQPRRVPERTCPEWEVIGVISARGKAGKSTIAANLAIALKQESQENVALIDAGFGDACFMLKLTPVRGIVELGPLAAEVDEEMLAELAVTHSSGVQVLSTHTRVDYLDTPPVAAESLRAVTDRLRDSRRHVVIDCPAWQVGSSLEWAAEWTTVLLVLSAWDLLAVRDSRALIDALQKTMTNGAALRVVLNRYSKRDPINLASLEENLNQPAFVTVPNNTSLVTAAMTAGNPVMLDAPDSDVAAAIRELARKVVGMKAETSEPRKRRRPLFRL